MQLITLKSFKSYEDQMINNLSPHINVILGRNGEGKSNFFRAICFAMTDRIPLNRSEFNSHTHRAMNNEVQPISVEVYFRGMRDKAPGLFHIQRTWHSDVREELKVEEQSYSKEEFEVYVQTIGVAYSNSYHIVQQGRITSIAAMDPFELYNLLQAAAGCRRYEQRHEEATELLRRNATTKKEITDTLQEIETRLKTYEAKKQEFDLHHYEEIANKLRTREDDQQRLTAITDKLAQLRYRQKELADQHARLRNKSKDLKQQLQQLQQNIAVNQRQLCDYPANPEDDELQSFPVASQQLQDIAIRLRKATENKQRLKAEWERKSKETQVARKEMQAYQAKLNALTAQSEGEKLAKTAKGKAQVRATIDRLQQNIQATEEDSKKMGTYLKEFKVQSGNKEMEQANSLKEKLNTLNTQLKAVKVKSFAEGRIKNQLQSEVQTLTQQCNRDLGKLRKVLPLLDLTLLRQLRRQKVPGVLGYLLQFVKINPQVSFAYQMAGAARLCTLLVQEQGVCSKVIDANRKLKGRQVNMLPMSVVRRQPAEKHSVPSLPDCYSLNNHDWVQILPHPYGSDFEIQLRKIISNTFGKYLLVQTYEQALQISKRYHLNCITSDREVVYSEGYFSKVGRQEGQEDRLELYYRFAEKERLAAQAHAKLIELNKQIQALQTIQLDLNKRKSALQIDSISLNRKIDQINYQKRAVEKVQQQLDNLARKKTALEGELKRAQELMAAIQSKKIQAVSPKELKSAQQQAADRARIYEQRGQEEWAIEQKLAQQAREEETLTEKLSILKQQADFSKSFAAGYINEREFRIRLERELKEQQRKADEVERAALQAEEQARKQQAAQLEILGQMALLGEQIGFYESRIAQVGQIDLTLQQVEDRSHSLSVSFAHASRRRPYISVKQKLLFSKVELYRQQFIEKKTQFQQLQHAEVQLQRMLDDCQKEKELQVSDLFKHFQQEFVSIFEEVTGGRSEVRLKKSQEKTRGFTKFRNSLSIMVAFTQGSELTSNWGEFSGGQKSVLAFCVLMALQRCQPAPFYVLDEIDAALDPQYLSRIVGLIRKESQRSQYFISSFKREMLDFPEEICNYYLTEMHNRVSTIRRISQTEAQSMLNSLNN